MADFNNPFQSGQFRTPYYGPGQSPALMQDPASAMIMMFGMPLLQGAMGKDKFLPHFTPNQALMDQFLASQYQRATIGSSLAASRMGEQAVSDRILGGVSILTGTPASQLNREQANTFASMINHPIAKMMIGQMMGPENMEALMFGRKGDPAALASAVGRVGFFRRDSLGGARMSAQSLEDFSKSIHANLYGPNANVDDMRGFMAGQAGQMFENLFQRGMLPQSIGSLSAADRVRLMGREAGRDDATMNRLADEFGRRELMKSDRLFDGRRFDEVTEEQQKLILERERPGFRSRLDDTFKRVDAFNSGAGARGKSPADMEKDAKEIEQLSGYNIMARNVDASKAADKVKEFAGAVAAVREIFGDNGNPNAPMPSLMAALDQLTQGAMPQMSVRNVESTVRQMRLAARDAGIGMEQLMGMSAQMGAYGDTLGIARPISMQNTLNAALMSKAMRDAGAFSTPRFGQTDQATATQEAGAAMQRGDASGVGMTLGGLRRAVEGNPELYKGTEVEKLVEAYTKNQTTYTYNGRTVNLADVAGKGGAPALAEIFTQSGGSMATLNMYAMDQMTQKYINAGYTYKLQSAEVQRDVANGALGGMVMDQLDVADVRKTARALGVSEKDAEAARFEFGKTLSDRLAGMVIKETANMEPEERVKYLRDKLPQLMKETFMAGGVKNEKEAERRAAAFIPVIFGSDEKTQLDMLGRLASAADVAVQDATGRPLTAFGQRYSPEVIANLEREQAVSANRAERMSQMQRGKESSLLQRIGEEAERVGQGGTFNLQDSIQRITNVLSVAGLRDAFAPELARGFGQALAREQGLTVQEADVKTLIEASEKGGAAGEAALKKLKALGRVDDSLQVVADDTKDIDPTKQITRSELKARAGAAVGGVAGFTDEERRKNKDARARLDDYYQAMVSGDNESLLKKAASNLADEAVAGRGMTPTQAHVMRTQYEKAAMGDAAALESLKKSLSAEEFQMIEGLHSARSLAEKGIVLGNEGFNQTLNAKSEQITQQEIEAAAKAAREARGEAADGKTAATDAAAATTTAKTESMSVEAARVVVNMGREASPDGVAANDRRGPTQARDVSGAQSGELAVNGTLVVRGMHEAVIGVVGERPVETPDGPSIMNMGRNSGVVMA